MEIQLKQRLVGLTVIFSLAVIFLPMLLDGSGLAPRHLEITIPPKPQIHSNIRVEEKVIELKKETTERLKHLEPVIVDEFSDPPDDSTLSETSQETKPEPSENEPGKKEVVQETAVKKVIDKAVKALDKEIVTAQKETIETPAVKQTGKVPPKVKPKVATTPQVGGLLWVIQTGSFRDKNLAYKQRDRIRKSKLSAVFIEKYEKGGSLNYRVRMGPFLTRKKADIVRNKVMAKYNIKGIAMKYEK